MPINTAIYGQRVEPNVGNALQAYAQMRQVANNNAATTMQNQLQQYQLNKAQQEDSSSKALRDAYSANLNPDGTINYGGVSSSLIKSGAGDLIPSIAKQQREDQTARLDYMGKILKTQGDLAKGVMAAPTLQNAMASLDQMEQITGKGTMDAERQALAKIGDNPDGLKAWAAGHALTADALVPKVGSRDLGGVVQATTTDPLTGRVTVVDTTPKTQTIGEAETKRHNLATEDAAIKALNNPGMTYQVDGNGNIVALPTRGAPIATPVIGRDGKPVQGNKGLTEVQSNATAFGMRAQAAQDGLTALEQQGIGNPGITAKMVQGMPVFGNTLTPETQQQYNQYKRNFISAVLRKESGAAISNSEYANEDAKYFPQPGDSQKTIEQKRASRDLAIQALKVQAGPGSKDINGEGGASLPPVNAQGWALHVDAKGNKAYVSPDGKRFQEVK